MLSTQYDIIFSMGSSCSSAMYMKRADLRTFASPFDWLTHADFATRLDLMLNDFKNFLNLEDLRPLPPIPGNKPSSSLQYVENIKNGFYFYHDFPQNIPIEKSFPEIKKKYDRRIERFYSLIREKKKILIIWFGHDWITDDSLIVSLWQKFCRKMNKQIDLLVIEDIPEMPYGEHRSKMLADNIMRYSLHYITFKEDGFPTILGDTEHCDKIFRQFSLRNSLYHRIKQKIWYFLPKILCCFVPVSRWRKRIRLYFKWS